MLLVVSSVVTTSLAGYTVYALVRGPKPTSDS